ncbi:MAG TPA: hypothetical protein VMG12_32650 [Polyangiaceae bacterium]|nr:hypothetical protein [Polyangiaceae bacterium]
MNKKAKWTLALLSLTAGVGMTAAFVEPVEAQTTLGCRLTPSVPRSRIGDVVSRTCSDGSAQASAKFMGSTGVVFKYDLRIDLKKAAAISASVAIAGAQGEPILNGCSRSDGSANGQAVTFSCDIPIVSETQPMTMRLVAGDGVGG